jgi:hypothetical protein
MLLLLLLHAQLADISDGTFIVNHRLTNSPSHHICTYLVHYNTAKETFYQRPSICFEARAVW